MNNPARGLTKGPGFMGARQMANITIFPTVTQFTYNQIFQIGGDDATVTNVSTTNLSGTVGAFTISMNGTYQLFGGQLTGGTITSISFGDATGELGRITDIALDVIDVAFASESQIERMIMGGDDTIVSASTVGDFYSTITGNDRIQLGTGDDTVFAGAGTDTFVIDAAFATARIDNNGSGLLGQTLQVKSGFGTDTLYDVEILQFTNGRYGVQLGDGNTLNGANDTINGDSIGNVTRDIIFGEAGDDRILGKSDNDRLFGNEGRDTIFGGNGVDLLVGGAGADTLNGQNGRDELLGGSGGDVLNGGTGNDLMLGQAKRDHLDGGAGHDTMLGGAGADVLVGRKGNDTLTGGSKRDEFHFRRGDGTDTITDFVVGTDLIKIFSGANRLGQITFEREGADVRLSFANVEVLVENTTIAQMNDADNFSFV